MRRKAAWIAILLLGGCAPDSGLDNGAPALGLTVTRADASGISAIFTDGKVTLELKAIVSNGLVQTIIRDGAGTDLTVLTISENNEAKEWITDAEFKEAKLDTERALSAKIANATDVVQYLTAYHNALKELNSRVASREIEKSLASRALVYHEQLFATVVFNMGRADYRNVVAGFLSAVRIVKAWQPRVYMSALETYCTDVDFLDSECDDYADENGEDYLAWGSDPNRGTPGNDMPSCNRANCFTGMCGEDPGCCGNYSGCCLFALDICNKHDWLCHCCDEPYCGAQCVKAGDCPK